MISAEVRIPFNTNLPRDVAINTFNFTNPDGGEADWTAAATAINSSLSQLYLNTASGQAHPLGYYLSSVCSRATNAVKLIMRFNDGLPNDPMTPPYEIGSWTLPAPADVADLPNEVASCLSYKVTAGTTTVPRGRGRVFFGPHNFAILDGVPGVAPHLSDEYMADLAFAAEAFRDRGPYSGSEWGVWSRAANAILPIVDGWIDNECDTQRRREQDATERLLWPPI